MLWKHTFVLGILDKNKNILNIIFLWLKHYIYTARITSSENQWSLRFAVSSLVYTKIYLLKNGVVNNFLLNGIPLFIVPEPTAYI